MAINMTLKRVLSLATDELIPKIDLTNVLQNDGSTPVGSAAASIQSLANPNAVTFPYIDSDNVVKAGDNAVIRSKFNLSDWSHNHPEAGDTATYLDKVLVEEYDNGKEYSKGMLVYYSGVTLKYTNSTPSTGNSPNYPAADSYWTLVASGQGNMTTHFYNKKVPLSGGKIPESYFPPTLSDSLDFRGVTGNLSDDDAVGTHLRGLFEDVIHPAEAWDNTITYSEGDWSYEGGSYFRYINATPSSGNATSNETYWKVYDSDGYEEHLRSKRGVFLIVSDDGYIAEWLCATQNDWKLPELLTYSEMDDPQAGVDGKLHLEAGDMIFFTSFSADGSDPGYYRLYFKILNGNYPNAYGGITGRKGVVVLSDKTSRYALSDQDSDYAVINEGKLRELMHSHIREIDFGTSLPSGDLKYYNTSIGNVTGMSAYDIALIGSGTVKTIYRRNAANTGWDSTFGTVTLGASTFREEEFFVTYTDDGTNYVAGTHRRAADTNGTVGIFVCKLQTEALIDGDLFFTEEVAVA